MPKKSYGYGSYSNGGWLNNSSPDLTTIEAIFPDDFDATLRKAIGRYRLMNTVEQPSRSEEINQAESFIEDMSRLAELETFSLTPVVSMHMVEEAHKAGVSLQKIIEQFRETATQLEHLATVALVRIERETEEKRGRKSNYKRDRLLATLLPELTKTNDACTANRAALLILKKCSIPLPINEDADIEDVARAIRRSLKNVADIEADRN